MVLLVHPDQLDLLDHKAITVILEMWVLQVTMVHPGHKVLLVQLALQAHKALKALKALQVLKDPQELLARKVHQGYGISWTLWATRSPGCPGSSRTSCLSMRSGLWTSVQWIKFGKHSCMSTWSSSNWWRNDVQCCKW